MIKILFSTITLFLLLIISFSWKGTSETTLYGNENKVHKIIAQHLLLTPPIDSGEYFLSSSSCMGCHGYDPAGIASVDLQGNDVNLVDDWQASMMALSGIDPFWRAKVRHEVLTNPSHSTELQTFCTSCHAPMGRFNAYFKGQSTYTLDDLQQDSLGLGGIGCLACHSIKDEDLGALFSGQIPYDSTHKAYGPFAGPVLGPMQLYEGFDPVYGPHMSESRSCSPCHTLVTNTVNLNGQPTGQKFVEQATFHEWLNSKFPQENTECQTCHMPKIEDPVKLAVGYISIPARSPFNLHKFSGANSFMVDLIRQYKNQLGVNVAEERFNETIADILHTLTTNTAKIKLFIEELSSTQGAILSVEVENLAGHKFPSGYPARRAVLQFWIKDVNSGQILFSSGLIDSGGEIIGITSNVEPHHDTISQPSQAQIYEFIMADVNGNRTTVLERAAFTLKDNRLPPKGFTQTHPVYDTVKIVGVPPHDVNFNRKNGVEGSGTDKVFYKVMLPSEFSIISIYAKLVYQPLPPAWMDEMFVWSAPEIDLWKNMYLSADKKPVIVASDSILNLPTYWISHNAISESFRVFPNPVQQGKIFIHSELNFNAISLIDSQGKIIGRWTEQQIKNQPYLCIPKVSGSFILKIDYPGGEFIKKIIVH